MLLAEYACSLGEVTIVSACFPVCMCGIIHIHLKCGNVIVADVTVSSHSGVWSTLMDVLWYQYVTRSVCCTTERWFSCMLGTL